MKLVIMSALTPSKPRSLVMISNQRDYWKSLTFLYVVKLLVELDHGFIFLTESLILSPIINRAPHVES